MHLINLLHVGGSLNLAEGSGWRSLSCLRSHLKKKLSKNHVEYLFYQKRFLRKSRTASENASYFFFTCQSDEFLVEVCLLLYSKSRWLVTSSPLIKSLLYLNMGSYSVSCTEGGRGAGYSVNLVRRTGGKSIFQKILMVKQWRHFLLKVGKHAFMVFLGCWI